MHTDQKILIHGNSIVTNNSDTIYNFPKAYTETEWVILCFI
jgi:hypothetical protein